MESKEVWIDYTNWRGERRWRRVEPHYLYFGATQWHPERQWLLVATDCESGGEGRAKDFALAGIHGWRSAPPEEGTRVSLVIDEAAAHAIFGALYVCFSEGVDGVDDGADCVAASDAVERIYHTLMEAFPEVEKRYAFAPRHTFIRAHNNSTRRKEGTADGRRQD